MEWQGHALWVELIVRRRLRARVALEGAILVIAMVGGREIDCVEINSQIFLKEEAKGVAV